MNPFENVKFKSFLPAKNHVKEHLAKYAPEELQKSTKKNKQSKSEKNLLNELKKMSPEKREEILQLLLMDKQPLKYEDYKIEDVM